MYIYLQLVMLIRAATLPRNSRPFSSDSKTLPRNGWKLRVIIDSKLIVVVIERDNIRGNDIGIRSVTLELQKYTALLKGCWMLENCFDFNQSGFGLELIMIEVQ